MIPETKYHKLQELIKSSTKEEIIWINGYLNGLVSGVVNGKDPKELVSGLLNGIDQNGNIANGHDQSRNGNVPGIAVKKMTIAYGTETGNSKKLALQFAASAKKEKLGVKCIALEQYRPDDLGKEDYFFVIISTQGEGEPPETAKKFIQHIDHYTGRLEHIKFSVLALGDSSYPLFCKTGEDLDQRLSALGATRVIPLVKCDVDFEEPAAEWFHLVEAEMKGGQVAESKQVTAIPAKKTGKKFFEGKISKSINLNDRGSGKQTYHMEITTGEDMDYEPGDSIAIIPANQPDMVDQIIELLCVDGSGEISVGKFSGTVRELLLQKLNICYLLTSTVKKYASLTGHDIPDMRIDLVDLLRIYPLQNKDQSGSVLNLLNPIAPRLYSVSSSAAAGNREVHITVSRHRFMSEDEQKYGLCSSFLGDLPVNSAISFYIHRNRAFKLPSPETDIIMVGPGTGIAPFRSFLIERDINGAAGRNWLFFGEQHFQTDFLYQTEIQQYLQTGVLSRVSLAFSRDQQEKIYVQHRMYEQGEELYNWLMNGAIFYVSGTKDPMSVEVEQMLLKIIRDFGKKTEEEAAAFLEQLKKEDRYHKDVY